MSMSKDLGRLPIMYTISATTTESAVLGGLVKKAFSSKFQLGETQSVLPARISCHSLKGYFVDMVEFLESWEAHHLVEGEETKTVPVHKLCQVANMTKAFCHYARWYQVSSNGDEEAKGYSLLRLE